MSGDGDMLDTMRSNLMMVEAERKKRTEAMAELKGHLEAQQKESAIRLHDSMQQCADKLGRCMDEIACKIQATEMRLWQEIQDVRNSLRLQRNALDLQAIAKTAAATAAATTASQQSRPSGHRPASPTPGETQITQSLSAQLSSQISRMQQLALEDRKAHTSAVVQVRKHAEDLVSPLRERVSRIENVVQGLLCNWSLENGSDMSASGSTSAALSMQMVSKSRDASPRRDGSATASASARLTSSRAGDVSPPLDSSSGGSVRLSPGAPSGAPAPAPVAQPGGGDAGPPPASFGLPDVAMATQPAAGEMAPLPSSFASSPAASLAVSRAADLPPRMASSAASSARIPAGCASGSARVPAAASPPQPAPSPGPSPVYPLRSPTAPSRNSASPPRSVDPSPYLAARRSVASSPPMGPGPQVLPAARSGDHDSFVEDVAVSLPPSGTPPTTLEWPSLMEIPASPERSSATTERISMAERPTIIERFPEPRLAPVVRAYTSQPPEGGGSAVVPGHAAPVILASTSQPPEGAGSAVVPRPASPVVRASTSLPPESAGSAVVPGPAAAAAQPASGRTSPQLGPRHNSATALLVSPLDGPALQGRRIESAAALPGPRVYPAGGRSPECISARKTLPANLQAASRSPARRPPGSLLRPALQPAHEGAAEHPRNSLPQWLAFPGPAGPSLSARATSPAAPDRQRPVYGGSGRRDQSA